MAENIVHLVLARTPDAPEGVKGISLFVVPKYLVNDDGSLGNRNDVKCISIEEKLGIHASPTCVMAFGDEDGAVGYLVGEENRGLQYMFTMMNFARLEVGIEGLGISERSYQRAAEFAKGRVQGRSIGKGSGDRVSIIHHPDVRRMLLTMKSQIEAMRALTLQTCLHLDLAMAHSDDAERVNHQNMFDLLTPVVKGWCTEQSIEITSLGIQVHGGMGFVEETGAAQYLRDARIAPIYEGTTGIQANDLIGRKVAAEKGVTAFRLIASMRDTINQLETFEGHSGLQTIKEKLQSAVDSLEQAVSWVVETYLDDPQRASAGSVPLLKLFGTVSGGWMLARSAIIAKKRLDAGVEKSKFYRGKLATCRFYSENILPISGLLRDQVIEGHKTIVAMDETYF
jgi:acyl-CoA dehydrogenase